MINHYNYLPGQVAKCVITIYYTLLIKMKLHLYNYYTFKCEIAIITINYK